MSEPTREALAHRPVLRAPSGSEDVQLECSCGWLWNEDDPVDLPEGEDFIRHLAALPSTPQPRPSRHEHCPEYPSACTGCEHLAVDLASRLPPGLLSTPPPSLDRLRAIEEAARAFSASLSPHDHAALRAALEGAPHDAE